MQIMNYNFSELYFNLENITNDQERLNYLYRLKLELRKTIKSFSEAVQMPMRMFLEEYFLKDEEYKCVAIFLKKIIEKQSTNPRDKRYPSEDYLRGEIKKEIIELEKLDKLVTNEILQLNSSASFSFLENEDF